VVVAQVTMTSRGTDGKKSQGDLVLDTQAPSGCFEITGNYFPVLHAKSTSAICFNSQIDNASVATQPLGTRGNVTN